jgi:protein O-GlcNAc transferase
MSPLPKNTINPAATPLHRAVELHRLGQLAEAASLYHQVLRAEPHQPDALHLLGLIAQHEGRLDEAVERFTAAIAANPKAAVFRLNRGITFRTCGRTTEALEDLHQAALLDPGLAEAHHQHGNALKSLGRYADAIIPLERAVKLAPLNAAAWLNLGTAHLEENELEQAIRCFREALRLEPSRSEAFNILGHALALCTRFQEAETQFREALRLNPNYAAAHDNLGGLLKSQARIPDALEQYRAALKSEPLPATHSNLLLALNFNSALSPEAVFLEHRKWDELHSHPLRRTWRPHEVDRSSGRRLRIGYVSADFVNHAVAHFVEPVLQHHDHGRVEVYCYSQALVTDPVTSRLRGLSDHWRDIARINDADVADLIRGDQIDILIDLAGHTARNRLLVFARKPAPLQITWIGYPNTTGLSAIDYRITDGMADPIGETEHLYSEKLIRLPECFSSYLPSSSSPPVSPLPASSFGHVTFGSFNQFPKLSPAVIELWARVLRAVPTAHLFLRARSLADDTTAARLKERFASLGVTVDRLEFDGRELSVVAHQGAYQRVDIGLDPFPYNGTTTTCEALWSGVPVVTLAGNTHVSRVGVSLLTQIEAIDWIARSADEYVEHCVTLARDLTKLASVRAGLRSRLLSSPLGNAPRFTRHLEAAYSKVWDDYCRAIVTTHADR